MNNTKYYDELIEMKNNNALFKFSDITKQQLRKLWHEEYASDIAIAELFDVSKYAVTKKRKDMKLSLKECVFEDVITEYDIPQHIQEEFRLMYLHS